MTTDGRSLLTGPSSYYPLNGHALDLFEEWARSSPSLLAVSCRGRCLTYGELDSAASALARYLVEDQDVQPSDRVVVCMDRSIEVLVAIVAVLKAGGVYVPLEPSYPSGRLAFLVADADPAVLLIDEFTRTTRPEVGGHPSSVVIEADDLPRDHAPWTIPGRRGGDADFYLIYTSGTTGAPKGALVCHRNIVNVQHAWIALYDLQPGTRCYQTTTLGFDVFTADWTRALASGAALYLSSQNYTLDPSADIADLVSELTAYEITFAEMNTTTTRRTIQYLVESGHQLTHLRTWIVGADAWYLDEHMALESHFQGSVAHFNTYGVSECAVDSMYFESSMCANDDPPRGRSSVIGRPFPNTKVAVIGADSRILPIGEVGELCIVGAGVGQGYFRRPELTDQRFGSLPELPGEPCYRTGDLAFVNLDGLVEFQGRADDQVEIGSKRVELAEVQHAAMETGLVKDCVAFGRKLSTRETELWLAAVPAELKVTVAEINRALVEALPKFMRPAGVLILDVLPLTPNGKLDRRVLVGRLSEG